MKWSKKNTLCSNYYLFIIISLWLIFYTSNAEAQQITTYTTEVLIVGGGTGGIAAGIESARNNAKTIIVSSTSWLGGMLTTAGVSATDGNDKLPSGIWQEFREALYKHYGSKNALSTGWVSSTLFEPHVGDSIFKAITDRETNLKVIYNFKFDHVLKEGKKVTGVIFKNDRSKKLLIKALVTIDATELGDVYANAGCSYFLGMDSKQQTGESFALQKPNNIIQDMTYVAILKDYGIGADKTIPRPKGYDSTIFFCSCKSPFCKDSSVGYSADKMLAYGRLPNNKYMINWPIHGNDIYINVVEMPGSKREAYYQEARQKTLSFVYYIQHQLGYKNLGLADDEFPTKDKLPFIPYHREGRRVKGVIQFNLNELMNRYSDHLYRTDIAVGDYPIDQHHSQNPQAPKRNFPHVSSFGVPLGALIPTNINGLIVADKGISVTNIVNGATRLQPCVLLTGQAAGALAAYSVLHKLEPRDVNVRNIQRILLRNNAYLLPFIDVTPKNVHFKAIQRIGVTGIIKAFGVPYSWENETWFYPNRPISEYELVQGLKEYYGVFKKYYAASGETLTIQSFVKILKMVGSSINLENIQKDWSNFNFPKPFSSNLKLDREMTVVLIDHYLHPFDKKINLNGNLMDYTN